MSKNSEEIKKIFGTADTNLLFSALREFASNLVEDPVTKEKTFTLVELPPPNVGFPKGIPKGKK